MKTKTLQELHLEAIENSYHTVYRNMNEEEEVNNEEAASKSAEITEQIAIEFWSWMRENDTPDNAERYGNFTNKDMFQEFIKTRGMTTTKRT
jgi:hypothetical protein